MDELGLYDCPMPETFRDKFGITFFLTWLFYVGFVSRVIFGPLMPAIRADMGFSYLETGNLFFMITIGYMLAPICSGLISSRLNHLGTLKFSAWLLGVALLPLAFVDTLWGMGLVLMVIGFSGALHLPSAIATITAEIQQSDWGKGLSLHQCAPPLAFVSAPLIVALLMNCWSWRMILLGWGCIALLSALLYTRIGKGGEFPGKPITYGNVKKVVAVPSFWFMVILLSMGMAGSAGIFAMMPLFFVTERAFELGWANTVIGLSQISSFFVVLLAGIIIDKVGQKQVMAYSLGFSALLTLALGFVKGWALLVILFVQPAVLAAFFPAAFASLAQVAHPGLRSVVSAVGPALAFLIGAGTVPVAIGHAAEVVSLGYGIVGTGIFMLFGVPLVFKLRLGEHSGQAGC